jgi:hypothetical protein
MALSLSDPHPRVGTSVVRTRRGVVLMLMLQVLQQALLAWL